MKASRLLVAAALAAPSVTVAVLLKAFLYVTSDSKLVRAELVATRTELRWARDRIELLRSSPPVVYTPPEFPIAGLEARQSKLVTPSALRGEVSGA